MPKRPLITERDLRRAEAEGHRTLVIAPNTLVTALARDYARDHGLTLTERTVTEPTTGGTATPAERDAPPRTLALGCDHAGFAIKAALAEHARSLGWTLTDVGTDSDARCDYPDFAYAVARLVALGEVQFGLMIDGVGVGSAIVATKVPSVRAACCASEFAAFNARAHNDANVLTLGSRTTGIEVCKRIVSTFLETGFEGGRHAERVQKIADVEARFLPGSAGAL
jgi:ribose 5-phosphate isomerase B